MTNRNKSKKSEEEKHNKIIINLDADFINIPFLWFDLFFISLTLFFILTNKEKSETYI